ncbi:Uncharacterised protein [Amycolatopsis camponoti]|uniref:Uncharacterized protein n=1 Tax=Amycolatopsis camponoti TaxID=2606593 RepID=A0A6I8LSB0_9PSEU|nr:Uncharacterised protein [Amycolatopsis camponoti]
MRGGRSWQRAGGVVAAGAKLLLDDGVVCRPTCHGLGWAGLGWAGLGWAGLGTIVAAGAVARWPDLRYDATPRRDGQWLNAVEMSRGRRRTC